jgi:recombination associated protein RdgC
MADQLQQVEKVMPEDIARTFEAAVNVFQGKTEHMDDLLKNGGTLLRKVSKNFSSTQLILAVAALAVVSIVVIKKVADDEA